MRNQSVDPRQVAQMIVDKRLKRALTATQAGRNGRSALSSEGGILISTRDLESIANWLGIELRGAPQLDNVFQFVQSTLTRDLAHGAFKLTIALDRQSSCIIFTTAA